MTSDEKEIHELVNNWMAASKTGDTATLLRLMTDDVIFMVPGHEPFGKEAFVRAFKDMKGVSIEGTSDIQELHVLGDWAWMRNRLRMTMTPPKGEPKQHSGYALTVLRKKDGHWVVSRDANLLMPT